jgi:hypothetical protein
MTKDQATAEFHKDPAFVDDEVKIALEREHGVDQFRKMRLEAVRNHALAYPEQSKGEGLAKRQAAYRARLEAKSAPVAPAAPTAAPAAPAAPAYVPTSLADRMGHELSTNPREVSAEVRAYMRATYGEQAAVRMRLEAVERMDRYTPVTVRHVRDVTTMVVGSGEVSGGEDRTRGVTFNFDSATGNRSK